MYYTWYIYNILSDEDHFNSNVQLRRTAMEDTKMAKKYQMDELGEFKKQEGIRQQQLSAQ